MAFASKLQHVISKRGHMIKAAELQELFFDDKWHKVLLHGFTQGNAILCTVGDPYHLKPLSFRLAICNILSCFGWGGDSLVTGRKFSWPERKLTQAIICTWIKKTLPERNGSPCPSPLLFSFKDNSDIFSFYFQQFSVFCLYAVLDVWVVG